MCELVEGYINYLIDSKQYSLVATYCAVLPRESQLVGYALFLESKYKYINGLTPEISIDWLLSPPCVAFMT